MKHGTTLRAALGAAFSLAALDKVVAGPAGEKNWKRLESSAWIADGSARAPHIVYTFTDPNCPNCNRLWRDARSWVDSGKVQLRHVIVGLGSFAAFTTFYRDVAGIVRKVQGAPSAEALASILGPR